MKKLYLYIRLSDADDDLKFKTESESIANQRTLLYRFIRARREFDGYEVVEFIDDGYSGTNGNRPSFERMIESLKNGEANVVICKDFSRFFRDYVEIGDYLERIFPFLGVRFIAVNDGYDSDDYKGSTAGMEVVMKYIVYSYYSRDLSQKIKTVMSTRKSKGEFVASQAPYGYMKDPDVKRKIIPNPDTAPVVRKIFDLALEGKTPAEIAVVLNDYKLETPSAYYMRMNPDSKKFRTSSKEACWTVSNVREILKRREYTGVMVMNQRHWKGLDNPRTVWTDESEWQIIPDCHEAIVSESEYEEAQKVFRKIRKGYDRSPDQYLLRSLVHCGACGRTIGNTMLNLNQAILKSILLPVPPCTEQNRIINSIIDVDIHLTEITNQREALVMYIAKAKSQILDLAIRGKLVPQDPNDEPASVLLERIRAEKEDLIKQGKIKRDKKESVIFKGEDNSYYEKIGGKVENISDEIPFELPEGWAWCRGYSCFEGMESTKPQGDFFDYIDIDAIDNRLHCIKKTKNLPVSDAPSRASRAVKDGSVLFSLVRPYLENIALVEAKHSNCIASTGFYVCNSNGVLLPEFMFFLMISGYVVNGLNQYMKGDNSPSISKDNIENWLYPAPPIGEQQTICAKLKTVFTLVENVEKSLN